MEPTEEALDNLALIAASTKRLADAAVAIQKHLALIIVILRGRL